MEKSSQVLVNGTEKKVDGRKKWFLIAVSPTDPGQVGPELRRPSGPSGPPTSVFSACRACLRDCDDLPHYSFFCR